MCNLNAPQFNNEEKAREYLEKQRWPEGPICPHCGGIERIYPIQADEKKKIRSGLYQCNDCGQQFTVTVGTVFERSKVPLHKWLAATYLMCSSKKGISAKQIERSLGVTYKTAWFMCHRIREAMKSPGGAFSPKRVGKTFDPKKITGLSINDMKNFLTNLEKINYSIDILYYLITDFHEDKRRALSGRFAQLAESLQRLGDRT